MRPDQHQRYARHIQLENFGASGQAAIMQASARVEWNGDHGRAQMIAAIFLAAGGVGKLVVPSAIAEQRRELAIRGPDTVVACEGDGRDVECTERPAWWPDAPGDDEALAFFRGSVAAAQWMAETAR